jgi:hypothetical protein
MASASAKGWAMTSRRDARAFISTRAIGGVAMNVFIAMQWEGHHSIAVENRVLYC